MTLPCQISHIADSKSYIPSKVNIKAMPQIFFTPLTHGWFPFSSQIIQYKAILFTPNFVSISAAIILFFTGIKIYIIKVELDMLW